MRQTIVDDITLIFRLEFSRTFRCSIVTSLLRIAFSRGLSCKYIEIVAQSEKSKRFVGSSRFMLAALL